MGLVCCVLTPGLGGILQPGQANIQDQREQDQKTQMMMQWTALLLCLCVLLSELAAADTQVEVVKEASCRGKEKTRPGTRVTLDYDGYLRNDKTGNTGKKFTSTYSLSDPYSFTIGQDEVIPGLEQGLIGFCAGSELILDIPSELAYGEAGAGDTIPPRSDLIFEVVIIDVKIIETDHERNIRLEAKAREEEAKRREIELENRKNAEIKAKEDYERLLAEEQKRRELHEILVKEQQEKNRLAEIKAKEIYEKQIAEEQKRREIQAKQVEEQQELVRQELIRREEHQKLIDEELERRKAQQELVRLELIAREEEAERRRLELIRREEQKERVADELIAREEEAERRRLEVIRREEQKERVADELVLRNAEQERRDGTKEEQLSDEEKKIEAARKYFKNRRTRIRQ